MYLDTTILQSRTATTLIEFINELMNKNHSSEQKKKYLEIKKQYRIATKLEKKGTKCNQRQIK